MTTIKGPDFIALQVSDLEASRRFYTEILGLTEAPKSPPDAVLYTTAPIPFAIRNPLVDLNAVKQLGHGVALWLYCDNSKDLYKDLESRGVTLLNEPAPGPFGFTFQFKDLDGYVITIHDKA